MRITIQRASLTQIDIDLATIYGTALTVFPGSPRTPHARFPWWVLFLIAAAFALGIIVSSSGLILLFLAKVVGIASLAFLVLLALTWTLHWSINHVHMWWIQHHVSNKSSYAPRPASFQYTRVNKHRFLV
jgi:hypothetical protein